MDDSESGVVNIADKLTMFDDLWSPKTVGRINDLHIKVVKVEGDFVWHTHATTDELFLVVDGRLEIQMRGRDPVTLTAGEFFVVPRGVEHRPVARQRCELVLLEPTGVVNTGDVESDLTAEGEWI